MAGVIALALLGVWAVVGRWVWTNFVRRRVPARRAGVVGFAFAVAWFVVPVGDDILGAYHFERLCAEIPPTRYYGPIAVGPGAFFNEDGTRKWKTSDEFYAIRRANNEWEGYWRNESERSRIASWPMEIIQIRDLHREAATGRVVIESYFRGSGGGWLRDSIDSDAAGGYSCRSSGEYPQDEDTIVFHPKASTRAGEGR